MTMSAEPSRLLPGDAWNRYWFQPVWLHSLGLVRFWFGVTLLLRMTDVTGLWRIDQWRAGFPARPVFPSAALGDWKMPYSWLRWQPWPEPWVTEWLETLLLIAALLMTIGLATRLSALVTATIFTYLFFLSQWNYYHHMLLFVIGLWVLALSPCGEHFSVDASARSALRPPRKHWRLPLSLLQVLVAAIYLFTVIWKFNPAWLTGQVMENFEAIGAVRGPFAPIMLRIFGHQGLSLGTLAVEGSLPVLLFIPATRRLAIWFGLILHLMIDATMAVNSYSYQMMVLYIAFIEPAAGRTVVLYDGHCGLCQRSRGVARVLDWLQRVTWVDLHDPQVAKTLPELTPEQLREQMHVITPAGRILPGYRGWRHLLGSFPLTFLFWPLLWIPPIPTIGEWIYRTVAAARDTSACPLIPRREDREAWRETLERAARRR